MVRKPTKSFQPVGVTPAERPRSNSSSSPLTNRGVKSINETDTKSNQSVPNREKQEERERLNLSVGVEVKQAVQTLAAVLGMSESQLVVHALLSSFPTLFAQANAVSTLASAPGDIRELRPGHNG